MRAIGAFKIFLVCALLVIHCSTASSSPAPSECDVLLAEFSKLTTELGNLSHRPHGDLLEKALRREWVRRYEDLLRFKTKAEIEASLKTHNLEVKSKRREEQARAQLEKQQLQPKTKRIEVSENLETGPLNVGSGNRPQLSPSGKWVVSLGWLSELLIWDSKTFAKLADIVIPTNVLTKFKGVRDFVVTLGETKALLLTGDGHLVSVELNIGGKPAFQVLGALPLQDFQNIEDSRFSADGKFVTVTVPIKNLLSKYLLRFDVNDLNKSPLREEMYSPISRDGQEIKDSQFFAWVSNSNGFPGTGQSSEIFDLESWGSVALVENIVTLGLGAQKLAWSHDRKVVGLAVSSNSNHLDINGVRFPVAPQKAYLITFDLPNAKAAPLGVGLSGALRSIIELGKADTLSFAFSETGAKVAIGQKSGVTIVDTKSRATVSEFKIEGAKISQVVHFSDSNNQVVTLDSLDTPNPKYQASHWTPGGFLAQSNPIEGPPMVTHNSSALNSLVLGQVNVTNSVQLLHLPQ